MKKKGILTVTTILIVFPFLLNAGLLELYKTGKVDLSQNSKPLGKAFSNSNRSIASSPDGSIFVVNQPEHNVMKVDSYGNVKLFGKEGKADGELYFPGSPTILDEKFLVLGDTPYFKKASLYDLEGNFIRVVKLENPAYAIVSLKEGKIAYLSMFRDELQLEIEQRQYVVYIKDINTGTEQEIIRYATRDPGIMVLKDIVNNSNLRIGLKGYYTGDVYINRTKNGELLIGNTKDPEINIYSIAGAKIDTIHLENDREPITKQFIDDFKQSLIERYKSQESLWKDHGSEIEEQIKAKNFFDGYLPLFRKIEVDSEGNILVFKERSTFDDDTMAFDVYNPDDGQFICSTEIISGTYKKIDVDSLKWFSKISFSGNGVFAIIEDNEGNVKVVRKTL